MATGLNIEGFDDANIREVASLATDLEAGATEVVLGSAEGFEVDSPVLIGDPGTEQNEVRRITGVTGSNITVAATTYPHRRGTTVQALNGNQIKVWRAINVDGTVPADDAFTLLITVDIDPDNMNTRVNDPDGGSNFWYRYTYYNSYTDDETPLSDSVAARGEDYGHYVSLDQVRAEAGLQNVEKLSNTGIASARDNAESQVDGTLAQAGYELPMDPVPGQINQIAKMLAAGFVLNSEYGLSTASGDGPGDSRILWAEKQLNLILEGKIALIDPITKQVIHPAGDDDDGDSSDGGGRVAGYPDQDPDNMTGTPVRAFEREDEY